MPSRILAKALECSKGAGDDHQFVSVDALYLYTYLYLSPDPDISVEPQGHRPR
jgi:hypothetical protein